MDIYKHFKGGLYRYITDATLEWCPEDPNAHVIIYESFDDEKRRWVRPKHEFFGSIDVDGKPTKRFTKVDI